jgi:DNA-binding winged helix-turn-helix (wHTH) protein
MADPEANDLPEQRAQERLNALFTRLGVRENPFTLREADYEGPLRQAAYFFPHPLFREILGRAASPESVLVLAQKGAGKTTFRQEIERRCREGRAPVAGVLDATYTDFSRPLVAARAARRRATITDHLEEILRAAVARLLEEINEVRVDRFLALDEAELATLASYVRAYSPLLADEDRGRTVRTLLTRFAARRDLTLPDVSRLFQQPDVIRAAVPSELHKLVTFLLRLRDQPPRFLATDSYRTLLGDFLALLPEVGYEALYVLVDRLDEGSVKDPGRLVTFLAPLLTDLTVLDQPRLAIKFFLPDTLTAPLNRVDLRRKRLLVRHLVWSEDDLLSLLERRLLGFSRFRSLQNFCAPDLAARQPPEPLPAHPQARYIDWALVHAANQLPRDLILRCRALFAAYAVGSGPDLITLAELHAALDADLGEDGPLTAAVPAPSTPPVATDSLPAAPPPAPPADETIPTKGLYIDRHGYVYRDGTRLPKPPRPKEFAVLQYLCGHRYDLCRREDILHAIWPEVYNATGELTYSPDPELLTQTVRRLRLAVEPIPSEPRFILTVEGLGLRSEDG